MGVFDVPATDLIEWIARDLQNEFHIEKPPFTEYVKTGPHKERSPQREDWYYVRLASILYRVFKEGPLGVGSLRTYYGGRKNRGVKPHKFKKASGKIIRKGLQDLESIGLVKKSKKGRVISPKGHSYLTKKSNALKLFLEKKKTPKKESTEPLKEKKKPKPPEKKKKKAKEESKEEKKKEKKEGTKKSSGKKNPKKEKKAVS